MKTPAQEFAEKRLDEMERAPGMWALSKESFGLQLALLVEMHQMHRPKDQQVPPGLVMQRIFGPGNSVSTDLLDDEWAKERVSIARFCMEST